MPLTIPGMKPVQIVGMNGLNGMNLNGMGTLPTSMSALNGINSYNALNFGMMDPLLMASGIPQTAANFTGKVRVGVAAVKTGSPKFAPY